LRRVILAICATAVALVLLLSFKSHTQSVPSAPAAALGSPTPGTSAGSGSAAGGASTPAASGGAGAPGSSGKTVTGAPWPTIYGPVQVRITVVAGKVSAATATEYPTGTPMDVQINAFAIPKLNSEAVAAGGAKIDTVSGATYTSQGYLGSLQNALDKAGVS
jgi:FMN-binding domain